MGKLHEVRKEKHSFCNVLNSEIQIHSVDDLVLCFGDHNGHVGKHIDGFGVAYAWYDVGQRNLE